MAKTSYLPPEIIETILSKLSIKPLLRFKSVSKSWNALISPLSNSQDLLICSFVSSDVFNVVKLENQKLEIVQELGRAPYKCVDVICHCGGVLLLTDSTYRRHVLWNPSSLTQTTFWVPFHSGRVSYGLCYDPTTDDFKVVIVDFRDYSVFSCKNKSLIIRKQKFDDDLFFGHVGLKSAVCVDGAIYWVHSRVSNGSRIIYYDPRDDKFKILEKPENVEERKHIFLFNWGGYLSLYCEGQHKTTIKIWIKEKGIDNNSCKDFITIENVEMDVWAFKPQCLVGNKIVIRNRDTGKLVVYDCLEKTFEQFGNPKLKWYGLGLIQHVSCPFFPVKTTPKSKPKRKRL